MSVLVEGVSVLVEGVNVMSSSRFVSLRRDVEVSITSDFEI